MKATSRVPLQDPSPFAAGAKPPHLEPQPGNPGFFLIKALVDWARDPVEIAREKL